MSFKSTFSVIKEAIIEFDRDDATVLGAALAFYASLSLAPLLVILMFVAGVIGYDAQEKLIAEVVGLLGPQAAVVTQMIISNVREQQSTGLLSAILSGAALLLSATLVFSHLQTALNRVWNVRRGEERGAIIWWLRKRLFSLIIMSGIGLLMLVSLVVTTAVQLIVPAEGTVWQVLDFGLSFVIFTVIFGMIFKTVPDALIDWGDVLVGAIITAVLFDLGKFGIGKYLGYSGVGSSYGAAGSLVLLLAWVYYSSLIFFLGAEITQVIARRRHSDRDDQAGESEEQDSPAATD